MWKVVHAPQYTPTFRPTSGLYTLGQIQEKSMPDFIVTSHTATQEEVDHAVSQDWRKPIPVPEVKPEAKPEEPKEEAAPVVSEEETETAPVSEPESEQEQRPKGKGGFQKKIDKLTKEKGEALSAKETLERELAEFKDRFERLEKSLAPKAETKDEKPEAKPKYITRPKPLESEIGTKYKDWTEYSEDLIDWKTDEKLAARDQSAQQREITEIQQAREEGYAEAAKEFVEKEAPDFNDAVNAATKAGMKLPEPIIDLIKELPNGPAVTYYLVKNPSEALALIEMSPAMGFAAIGRISQGLEREEPAPKAPVKKVVSAAPPGHKPVAGNSAKSGNSLHELSQQGTDAYILARRQQKEAQFAAKNRRYS
jgi:hypothetical protein